MRRIVFLAILLASQLAYAQQIEYGCSEANFGVDADLYTNSSVFGQNANNAPNTDDWFSNPSISTGLGIGVIDVTQAVSLQQGLQAGQNLQVILGMSVPFNTIHQGVRFLDAIYGRDFYGGSQATDLTSFTQASKNGEDPAIWDTGPANVVPKNDLIDCYAHLRRDGTNGDDDLWLFGGFSRISNTGDSYLDMELYAEDIYYDPNTGFSSAGPDEGHTSWKFDGAGNIIQAGDIVVTVHYSTTGAPELELRIWVARNDWQNTNAATFTFGNEFDGGSNASQFGYADILPPVNGIYACGLGNMSTSFAPPWGTLDPGGNYSLSYEKNQLAEIGLNLNAFGIDPALNLHTENGPCTIPFSSVIFKARASNSFTAQLKDFAGPYPFDVPTLIPAQITGDTISCAQSIATLTPSILTADALYTWTTQDGNIIGPTDSVAIDVDAPGTYTLIATSAPGCLADSSSFYVPAFYAYPDANISADTIFDCGVDAVLTASPANHIYEWSGPLNFYSTDQIISALEQGVYIVTVTDPVSECSAIDSIYLPGGPCVPIDSSLLPVDENMVVLIDDEIPTAVFPADVTLYCTDDISDISLTGEISWVSDNCPENMPVPFYVDIAAGGDCLGSLRYNRFWYVRDFCGNLAFHSQVINLVDTLPPYFTTPPDITLDCTDDINDLTNMGDVLDEGDDCDGTIGEASYQDSIAIGTSCTGNDVIYRKWSLSDACGNEYSDFQVISFEDNIAPAFSTPNDITIGCAENPSDLTLTGVISDTTDNCGTASLSVIYTDQIIADPSCILNYTINRTWLVTDECGNFTNGVQTITVQDTIAPLFDVPDAITVSCETLVTNLLILGTPQNISDNCQSNFGTPTYRDSLIGNGPCDATRTILRTWQLSDACGNTNTQTQLIDFEDLSNPTFTPPANITIECDEDINDLNLTGNVFDELDNCSDTSLQATYTDNVTVGTPCNGSSIIQRTWTLVDDCGNTTIAVQQITMEDSTPPTFMLNMGPPSISCDTTLPTPVIGVDIIISDPCDTSLIITYTETQTDVLCANVYTLRRVWTAEDNCGNIDSLVQEISVEDTADPVILVFPSDITVSCDSILPPSGAVVDDNCTSTVTVNVVESTIPGSCNYAYILVRTWNWLDDCGNTNSQTQEITVIDENSPTFTPPSDTILACDANLADLNQTGTIDNPVDNCDPTTLDITYRDSILFGFPCAGSDRVIRIWEVSDTCGNQSSHLQVIDLIDTIPPVINAPIDLTLSCEQDPTDLGLTGNLLGATDNCDTNLGIASFQDSVILNSPCLGGTQIFRKWSLSDACGNISEAIQQITLVDTIAPTFTPPIDITLACDANPNNLTFTGDVLDEFDSCQNIIGDATYVDSIIVDQPCGGSTEIYRRWTLSDNCGNTISDVQYILLLDTEGPEMTLPDDITLDCAADLSDLTFTGNVTIASGDCDLNLGAASFRDSILTNSGCIANQNIIRIWSLQDDCGNVSTGQQLISLEDETAPTFVVPTDLTLDCGTDPMDLTITGSPDSLADNCSNNNLNISFQDSLVNFNSCGGTFTLRRTWTAFDDCGNSFAQIQLINFIDTIAPIFIAPIDVTISCLDDPTDLNLVGVIDTFSIVENCSAANLTIYYRDSIIAGNGCAANQDILRTWIVRDDCGNISEMIQQISILDLTAPVFDAPDDITLDCGTDISTLGITGSITNYSDDCSTGTMTQSYVDSIIVGNDPCVASEIIYRTWKLTDPCGNSDSLVQMITLVDELPPVFFIPSDTMLHCSVDYLDLNVTGVSFGAQDLCDDNLGVANFRDSLVVSDTCALDRAIYRTWSLADMCGNLNEYLQIIYLIDTIGPTFTVPEDVTISCTTDENDLLITGSPIDAFFNCQDQSSQVTYQDSLVLSGLCLNNFIYRTWTLSNGCGLDTSQLQMIELIDTIAPIFTNFPQDLTIACNDTIPTFNLQYFDSCGATITLEILQDTIPGTCLNQIQILKTYIISDPCGNRDSIFQNIEVENCGPDLNLISPDNIVACPGTTVELEVAPSVATSPIVYQWQYYNVNQWENILGATDSLFTIQNIDSTQQGNYRCIAAGQLIDLGNDTCQIISPEITVQVVDLGPIEIVQRIICQGDSVMVNGQTYSVAGTFFDTLNSVNFCDSIVQIEINVLPTSSSQTDINICQGDSILIQGSWISTSTILLDTFTNNVGCDSIHTTNIVIDQWVDDFISQELCIGDSLFIGGGWQTQNGTYVDTLVSMIGCDTILFTQLDFNLSISESVDYRLCEGDTLFLGTQTIVTSGVWTETLVADAGCDSVVTVTVDLIPVPQTLLDSTLCTGDSLSFDGIWRTTSGIFHDTLVSDAGCDSLIQLTLNFIPSYNLSDTLNICVGDSVIIAGNTIFTSGTYIDSLSTQLGCDSIINYLVNVHPLDTTEMFRQICQGDFFLFNNDSLTVGGNYTANYLNQNNCDSIVQLELEVINSFITPDSIELCEGDSVIIDGIAIFTNGSYSDSLVTQFGCDSIITYEIVFHPADTSDIVREFCLGESFIFGNDTLTTSGNYSQLLNNQLGCDSLVNLTLDFIDAYRLSDTLDLCEGETVLIAGMPIGISGNFTDSLLSQFGCDSIINYLVNVHPLDTTDLFRQICIGDSFIFNTDTLTASGNYTANYTNQFDCDSLVRLELEVIDAFIMSDSIDLCEGDSVVINGITIFTNGSYSDSLVTQFGCDSIINFEVIFHSADTSNIVREFCLGESFIFGNDTLTTSGSYSQLLNNQLGCDSLVNLTLDFIDAYRLSDTLDLCEGETVLIAGMPIGISGNFTDSLLSQFGCDSIINYLVNVHPLDTTDLFRQICLGDFFLFNTDTLTASGNYTANYTNQFDCDSLVRLELDVIDAFIMTDSIGLCEGDSVVIDGIAIFTNGTYSDSLVSQFGCDSIINYEVVFHPADTSDIERQLCFGSSYVFGNNTLTIDGNYSETFINQFGCDSLVNLNLEFIDAYISADTIDLCQGESVLIGGNSISLPGTYTDSLLSYLGCDSIINYLVNVHLLDTTDIAEQICEGSFYIFNTDTLYNQGSYSALLTNQFGCDSLVNLNLSVVDLLEVNIDQGICFGDSILINGIAYNSDTLLVFNDISTISACDSITNINIYYFQNYLDTVNYQICLGDSLELFGNFYNQDAEIIEESQSQDGCDSTNVHILEVIPVAELFVDDAFICRGDSVQLLSEGSEDVTWFPATGLSCTNCTNPMASPEVTTTYTVSTVSCLGQIISQLVTVYVYELPTIAIDAEGELIQGDTLALTYTVSDTLAEISWYMAPNDLICQGNCPDTLIVVPTLSSTYIVEAIDAEGCKNQDELSVRIKNECVDAEFFFPNFITPNFDGKNDEFVVSYDAIKEMSLLRIFNRWGELVFETTDIDNNHWNGTFRGKPVNAGVYVFYVEGFCLNNSPFIEKGNITVIR